MNSHSRTPGQRVDRDTHAGTYGHRNHVASYNMTDFDYDDREQKTTTLDVQRRTSPVSSVDDVPVPWWQTKAVDYILTTLWRQCRDDNNVKTTSSSSWMAAVIAITVTVILAQCSRLTSMITPANRSAAVIIANRRHDHEFVIIAPVFSILYKVHQALYTACSTMFGKQQSVKTLSTNTSQKIILLLPVPDMSASQWHLTVFIHITCYNFNKIHIALFPNSN